MLLALHLETNGFLRSDLPFDNAAQPNLVQMACELTDNDARSLTPRRMFCELVRSEGWQNTPGAVDVHKVTSRQAAREGIPQTCALWALTSKSQEATAILSYQGPFARDVITSLLQREKHRHAETWLAAWNRPRLQFIDLGTPCAPICRLPAPNDSGCFKRPKIHEAAKTVLQVEVLEGADALTKLDVAKSLYFALRELQVLESAA